MPIEFFINVFIRSASKSHVSSNLNSAQFFHFRKSFQSISLCLYLAYQIGCSKFYVTIIHNVELSNHRAVVQQQVWYVCTQSHASIKCVVYLPVSGLVTLLCVQPYFFLSVCSADSWIHPNILCGLSFIWIADFTKFHSPFSYLQYSIEG